MSAEYPCIYFEKDGKCRKFSDDTYISYCVMGPCPEQKLSNADRIRAMMNHAKVFFAQLHRMKQARIGLSTPFGVIQHNNADYTSIPQEQPAEEET